ncbi:MAG: hypothetical protein RLO06_18115 [Parvibaculum sp.]
MIKTEKVPENQASKPESMAAPIKEPVVTSAPAPVAEAAVAPANDAKPS